MSNFSTPNFRGWRAVIVHRHSENMERLVRQLARLGIEAELVWPSLEASKALTLCSLTETTLMTVCSRGQKDMRLCR